MGRGSLRIFLGSAPGVGKTFAMLDEAHRRRERGTDVVVGIVETHGRAHTAAELEGLEILPRLTLDYRGSALTELDTAAVLARRPQVVLIDELAHTNVPGSRHEKRWQDVEEILDAGIDVLSTVNIQHLESLNDVVESITGIRQQETLPDEVVRRADQVQLVDMAPEALRRRMAHGNIYGPDKVDAALSNYFRVGNLSALREIALLWLADRVDEALERYRADLGIQEQWPARERIVVALTGGPGSETLLRRGARIATRAAGGDLIACHVRSAEGLASIDPTVLARLRRLARDLGAEFHEVSGHDVAEAILDHARGVNATQVVVGVSRRGRFQQLLRPSIASEVADSSGDIDVHLVSHEGSRVRRRGPRSGGLPARRVVAGLLLAVVSLTALTAVLVATRESHTLSLDLLLYLALTVVCALVGGIWPALFCAVAGSLLVNWFFTEPRGTLTISDPPNALALAVFILVAMAVSSVVNVAARRTEQAVSAERESAALAALSRDLLAEPRPLPALLEKARDALGMHSAVLTEQSVLPELSEATGPSGLPASSGGAAPRVLASTDPHLPVGSDLPPDLPWAVDVTVEDGVHLLLDGPPVAAEDQRLVNAYAAHAAILHGREQLVQAARQAAGLARDNAARTTLLAAVSHDLRTPLASIKAGVSTLRQTGLELPPDDEAELLESIEESADRLDALIGNLLDLSRLETGSVQPHHHSVDLLDAVVSTVRTTSDPGRVEVALEPDVPPVRTDLGLLDRVLANVVENALRHSQTTDVRITAGRIGETVQLRVVDRGPGVADADKDRIFAAFQRAGDAPQGDGLGLGLAVARGLMTVMGGTLVPEDTPGGGLTMVLELPVAQPQEEP
ncbi:sensor histidine kinase [Humibacillus xanthopallidus]|uniref:histidine kinase n=1 Tax=Humibacillus xanthopallidus TaxID=412689 RepID=A0A543HWK0_9MICO|nr:sensor histidine kinase KdpD [Humibacillus xanthopallidus]TQM62733.1 two-component system sensor histidine kinase KdpD [Humibacillus xanthopallidus]